MQNPVVQGDLTIADVYLMKGMDLLQPVLLGIHKGGNRDPKAKKRIIKMAREIAEEMMAERADWLAGIAAKEIAAKE